LQNASLATLGKTQHVDGPEHRSLGRSDRVTLVVDGARSTREVEYPIDLQIEGEADVVAYEFEILFAEQVTNIISVTGVEIIDANHFLPLGNQAITEMRA
jgi:hypothetical protein